GVAAEFTDATVEVDTSARRYTVSAGARWRDVLPALDPHGLSPAVTQSNNDFSVGGAISVNAHGWAVPRGPVGDTVVSLRVMTADGEILTCSPTENRDLFRHVVGGYGLFGAILQAEMEAAPNRLLQAERVQLPASTFAGRFVQTVHQPGVNLAYGRLSTARRGFLEQATLTTHREAAGAPPPLSVAGGLDGLGRRAFRAQTGSEPGKQFRWWAETHLMSGTGTATRNSLMNVPTASFAGTDPGRTDILHEYFVPPEALNAFLTACRRIIPASRQDLLNLTLRWVEADRHSQLCFAPDSRIALVMLFSQRISPVDEVDMRAMTRDLIDAALDVGGSFYLPYRLHARPDQLLRAYPA
ncbi:MAG: FAD-binding oxidoreductase, partial [Brevundimonas sp.]